MLCFWIHWQTPLGRHPMGKHPHGQTPPWAGTPQADTPLGRHHQPPLDRHPLWADTTPWADTPPPQQTVRILLECILFRVNCVNAEPESRVCHWKVLCLLKDTVFKNSPSDLQLNRYPCIPGTLLLQYWVGWFTPYSTQLTWISNFPLKPSHEEIGLHNKVWQFARSLNKNFLWSMTVYSHQSRKNEKFSWNTLVSDLGRMA